MSRFGYKYGYESQITMNSLEKPRVLAVGAVIGEPVSALYFPVSREDTGNLGAQVPFTAI